MPYLHPTRVSMAFYFCSVIEKNETMTQSAYITFRGNCREVMTFYKECIGGELTMQAVAGSPIEAQCPPNIKDYVMHASLTNGGFSIMATDLSGHEGYTKGNNVALLINCTSEEEITTIYNKLSSEGQITAPLKAQFWSTLFAEFVDKYGIRWMLNYSVTQ